MTKQTRASITCLIIMIPTVAFAQTQTLKTLISSIAGYFNDILALMMGFAVVMFVWYIIKYFIQPNDKRTEAGQYLMWSLIGFFVILSMWGIVNVIINTFNLGQNSSTSWNSIQNLFPTNGGSVDSGSNTFNQSQQPIAKPVQNNQPPANNTAGFQNSGAQNNSTSASNSSDQTPQSANANDLAQYNKNINSGVFSGNHNLITARVIDLATKKGIPVNQNSDVKYTSSGGVPVSVSVDGKNMPISQSDYSQAELNAINVAKSINKSLDQP